jgi:hypothetical protein
LIKHKNFHNKQKNGEIGSEVSNKKDEEDNEAKII